MGLSDMFDDMFNAEQVTALKNYKYEGKDDSQLYQKVLRPFALFCVDHIIPGWMPANAVTLLAFAFIVSGYILICCTSLFQPFQNGNGKQNEATNFWCLLYAAFSLFMYQTLDNCDGAVARKTNTQSAFGAFLDHSSDFLCTTLITLTSASIFGLTPTQTVLLVFTAWSIFAAVVLEQFCLGKFDLGYINGADEGPVVAILTYLMYAFYPSFFEQSWFFFFNNRTLVFYFCIVAGLMITGGILKRLYSSYDAIYSVHHIHKDSFMGVIVDTSILAISTVLGFFFCVPQQTDLSLELILYLLCATFTCHCHFNHIMLEHFTKSKEHLVLNSTVAFNIFVLLGCLFVRINALSLFLMTLCMWYVWLKFVTAIATQMPQALGIKIFPKLP